MEDTQVVVELDTTLNLVEITQPHTFITVGTQGPEGPPGASGSGTFNVVNKSADYYVTFPTDSDSVILVNTSSNNVTITLPTSDSFNTGEWVEVKKVDSSSNIVIVLTTGGQSIGSFGTTVDLPYQEDTFLFTSSNGSYTIS